MGFLDQPITLQSLFGTKRTIGPIQAQVVTSESTSDTLTITKQPVQQGVTVSDHAFKNPTVLAMNIYQQDTSILSELGSTFNSNGLAQLYQQFQDLQNSLVPFSVVTPTRVYSNVLMSTLGKTTDKLTENILSLQLTFETLIIVTVLTVQVERRFQKNAGRTGATQPAGKKSSSLYLGNQAIGGFFAR
jgi:hypothetical protein